MANITDIERLNYYEGEFLGALDFQTEQEYHRDMRRRHNLGPHTWGIVSGLELVQIPNGGTTSTAAGTMPTVDIFLQPGVAVDAFGREIVVLNKTQLTQDLFAAYTNLTGQNIMSIWISYAQLMLQPPADTCTQINQPTAFGRVQEAFALTPTQDGSPPPDSPIFADGSPVAPPALTGDIIFPPDDSISIPYQEFSTDDSAVNWYVPLGRVSWNVVNGAGVFVQQTATKLDDSWLAVGRQYAGIVASEIYGPPASTVYAPAPSNDYTPAHTGPGITLKDRFTTSPLPTGSNGVSVEVEGSLTVDRLLNAEQNVLVGSVFVFDPKSTLTISPVTIKASQTDQSFIQFRDSSGPQFSIWEIQAIPATATTPKIPAGLNLGETDSNGTPTTSDLLIQGGNVDIDPGNHNSGGSLKPGLCFGSNPNGPPTEGIASNQSGGGTNASGLDFYTAGTPRLRVTNGGNVGIGTATPRNRLGIRGVLPTEELLSFEDGNGKTRWHLNQNRPGPARGLNFAETDVADFRLFLQAGGNVGLGTGAPITSLDVASGCLHVAGNTPLTVSAQGAYLGWNALTGGTGETDFINNQGLGTGGFAFFNTPLSGSPRSTLMVIGGSGDVGISGGLTVGSSLAVNGSRTYLNGQDGANIHWIMGGGTVERVNNALAFSFDSGTNKGTISVASNWTFNGGAKIAYLADRFINRSTQRLERGDVVVLHAHAPSPHYGSDERIPLPEVQRADKECDTGVCGIVDEPIANPSVVRDLDTAKLDGASVGTMVTVGSYAYCKADAASGAISPGDLLTTSSTPGHAQKAPATGTVQAGAIIGKALGSLKRGKGIIPILVSHQ